MSRQNACKENIDKVSNFLGSDLWQLDESVPVGFAAHVLLRARSLAKAAYLLRLLYANPGDKKTELEQRYDFFKRLLKEQRLTQKEQITALHDFTAQLVQLVSPNCRGRAQKEVLKEIAQAEGYIIAYHSACPRDTQVCVPDTDIYYQVTTKPLTLSNLQAIYDDRKNSTWFESLPSWEQAFLDAAAQEGEGFITRKTPTTKTRPGASNFGRDKLTLKSQEAVFYYHSVPSKKDQDEACAVIKDYFSCYKEEMIDDFHARYPKDELDSTVTTVTIPVLMESLLTPAWYELSGRGSDNNTRMLALRREAIRHQIEEGVFFVKEGIRYEFQIIDNNQPINGRRSHRTETDRERLAAGCLIIRKTIQTILNYSRNKLGEEQESALLVILQLFEQNNRFTLRKIDSDRLLGMNLDFGSYSLFVATLKAYTDAWKKGAALQDRENHALYLASCESILMQEAGGVVQLNCKSSKDRVGLVKAHNAFLRACFFRDSQLPRYGQQFQSDNNKKLFNDCVATIPPVIANQVAPGCAGIKDEPLQGSFIAASTIRDVFWWKDNYAKNLPEFFRRANSGAYSGNERLGYGLLGFLSIFFPFLIGPIVRAMSFDAMVPIFATKDNAFKANKQLAKMNKIKAKTLSDKHVVEKKKKAVLEAQLPLVSQSHETVKTAVERYLQNPTEAKNDDTCFGNASKSDLRSSLYHEIFNLKKEKSKKYGIQSTALKHLQDAAGYATHTLIRDARNMVTVATEEDRQSRDAYNYAQFAAMYAITAETIFDLECYNGEVTRDQFQSAIKNGFELFKKQILETKELNMQGVLVHQFVAKFLIPILCEASNKTLDHNTALKYLDKVKDWVALYQPTAAFSTIDTIQKQDGQLIEIIRIEEPLTALTRELREEYNNYKEKAWYQVQPMKYQRLIEHFMPYILSEHQIPSQLRKYLPGLKNAYKSSIYLRNGNQLEKISHSNHCASVVPVIMLDHAHLDALKKANSENPYAHLSRKAREKAMREERVRLTKLALLQQRAVTGAESSTMVALNSSLADLFLAVKGFFKGEKMELLDREMVLATLAAARDLEDSHGAKICLNGWNKIETNPIDSIIAFAKKAKKLHKILSQRESSSEDTKKLLVRFEKSLVRLTDAIKNPWRKRLGKTSPEFKGVMQVQEFTLLSDLYNRLLATLNLGDRLRQQFKSHEIFYGCASGENRTGIVEFVAQIQAVAHDLPDMKENKDNFRATYLRLAQSDHVQYMVGSQGSILGTESIRDKSMGSLPSEFEEITDILSRLHSGFKSADLGFWASIIRGWKRFFGSKHSVVDEVVKSKQLRDREAVFQSSQPVKEYIQTIDDALGDMIKKTKERSQINYLSKLRAYSQALLNDKPSKSIDPKTDLIAQLKKLLLNTVVLHAGKGQSLPDGMKKLCKAYTALAKDNAFNEIEDFTDEDFSRLGNALKDYSSRNKKNTSIDCDIVPRVASILTGPLAPLLAAKFAMVLKAKIAIDATAVSAGSVIGRESRLQTSVLKPKTENGYFVRIKDVIEARSNLRKALDHFKDVFGVHQLSEAYVNSTEPTQPDLQTLSASSSALISSSRSGEEGCFVLTVNLKDSKLPELKFWQPGFKKEGGHLSNNISLAFSKNNLQQIRVEKAGRLVSPEKILEFMYKQEKREIWLRGTLDDSFVKKVERSAKKYGMSVIDRRDNRPKDSMTIQDGSSPETDLVQEVRPDFS